MATKLKDSELESVDTLLRNWASFVNDDGLPRGLWYPPAVYRPLEDGLLPDTGWRRQKQSKTPNQSLPDWTSEMLMDDIVNALNIEWQRVLYCHYQVRVKPEKARELRVSIRQMRLLGHDGRFDWPRYREERISDALKMPERTFRRSLHAARRAILAHEKYRQIL